MPKKEFLHLAHRYSPKKHGIAGHYWSEKLDGQRCFWDGGVSRGIPKNLVPWANTAKDARYKERQIATGLWSRYGNVIHAPRYFLDNLPRVLLDGELWSPNKLLRQQIASIIKKINPNPLDWLQIQYYLFDSPAPEEMYSDRLIDNPNFKKFINGADCFIFYRDFKFEWVSSNKVFRTVYFKLKEFCQGNNTIFPVIQNQLDFSTFLAEKQIEFQLERIANDGGEGLIVRNPDSRWHPWRSHDMLKVKKLDDAEGMVIGYTSGKETDKGSKHLGRIGALIIDFEGKRLELAGLNDEERILIHRESPFPKQSAFEWAEANPGKEVPENIESVLIPRGTVVTFQYRGLSKDGIPQEARYWRNREDN